MANDVGEIPLPGRVTKLFEMDEILHELREHSAGLNCGRWDYIFSCIKKFAENADFLLADRAQITMTTRFMLTYSLLCIQTCRRCGPFVMGDMAAEISRAQEVLGEELEKVKAALGEERYSRGRLADASARVDQITTAGEFAEFLTLPGYDRLA